MKTARVTDIAHTPLAVTMGDPAGVGPGITGAAWTKLRDQVEHAFFVIGAPELYEGRVPVHPIADPGEACEVFSKALPVLPLPGVPHVEPGKPDAGAATAILASIEQATKLCLSSAASGMVTNPTTRRFSMQRVSGTRAIRNLSPPSVTRPARLRRGPSCS